MKKIIALVLAVVLTCSVSVGLTVAYLTDRDSEANVFTVGDVAIDLDEKFEQESQLIPGETIEKEATITNTGKNSAWVWMTVAVPKAFVGESAAENMIHWNIPGAFWNGYHDNQTYIDKAIEKGYLPEGSTGVDVSDTWIVGTIDEYETTIDGVEYVVTPILYTGATVPGETTNLGISTVYLDSRVDIDPNGDMYKVVDGEATSIGWNVNKNGNPVIYVSAYAIQTEGFSSVEAAYAAYNEQWGDKGAEYAPVAAAADTWDGTADTSWYNETDTEFLIMTAEQLAGFADLVDGGNTFAGKTVKLGANIDLSAATTDAGEVYFDPIGSYKNKTAFMGTFDGQDYTISNLSQNTWALDNGYYYSDLGLGLFGFVEDAYIKDLNVDGADISGESALSGIVAAASYGTTTYENITVTNSKAADYQYYAGGIVAWASGTQTFINCDVDASTTIAAQWGDFDNSTGGIIGGCGGSATISLKDCDVACRIDAYNDVTSTYQWYAYRRCGMLIGNTQKTEKVDGTTYAAAPQLTCENVTVTYGDWANYTYCEFAGTNWPYVRVQAGISNSAYSNPRYGHPTDANGNEVVDDNHVHNDGEDHQILCVFDQLYGGGQGVYGTATHDGVTVIYNNK